MSTAARRAHGPTRRRLAASLVLWWAGTTGLVLLAGQVLTGPLQDAAGAEDEAVPAWLAEHRSHGLTQAAQAISFVGDTVTALVVTGVLLLLSWLVTRRLRVVVFLAVVGVGELATYLLTVNLVHRPRPSVPRLDPGLDPLHSYPSGHVAGAMATYGALAVLVWALHRRHRLWWAPLLLTVPVLIAVARVYLGVHHPTDVVASVLFMALWLRGCATVVLGDREPSRPSPKGQPQHLRGVTGAGRSSPREMS